MSNYSIIINSKFKPFSYAEMLAPVAQSTEAHQQVEEAYSALETQAEAIAAKANEQTDPKAYARYKRYSEELRRQADKLAKYGLQPDSRRAMFGLRSQYARDIMPIEEAVQKRTRYADMQMQAQLQNPTLLLGKRAATTSLDEFIDNPNIDFSQQYSGATLMQQVAQQAQGLAKELTSYGTGKPLDAYTNTFMKKFGFSKEQVLNAINNPNDPSSSKVLTAIVDQALVSSGITQWGDAQTLERARAYANQGLWSAVGQSDIATFDNFGAKEGLKFSQAVALENLRHQNDMAEKAYAARLEGSSSSGGLGLGLDDSPFIASSSSTPIPGKMTPKEAKKTTSSVIKDVGLQKEVSSTMDMFGVRKNLVSKLDKMMGDNAKYEMVRSKGVYGIPDYESALWKTVGGKTVLKSREEFINTGRRANANIDTSKLKLNDKQTREMEKVKADHLGKAYDEALKKLQSIGVNTSGVVTSDDVMLSARQYEQNSGAKMVSSIKVDLGYSNNKEALQTGFGNLMPNKQSGAWKIDNIEDIKKGPKKQYTASDILKNVEDNKLPLSYSVLEADGYQGILIHAGEDNYYLPADRLNNASRRAYQQYNAERQEIDARMKDLLQYGTEQQINYYLPYYDAYLSKLGQKLFTDVVGDNFGQFAMPTTKVIDTSKK